MNIPLTLYEYIALLVPGAVLLLAVLWIPQFRGFADGGATTAQLLIAGLASFVFGHLSQAWGRSLITWLRWRIAVIRNPKKELVRRTQGYDDPLTWLRKAVGNSRPFGWLQGTWVGRVAALLMALSPVRWLYSWLVDWPLRFVSFVVIPWPQDPMFSEGKVAKLKQLATLRNGGESVDDSGLFTFCFGRVPDRKQYDLFSAQADLFRGLIVSTVVLGVVAYFYGFPYLSPRPSPQSASAEQWTLLALAYVSLRFLERYQHFEYLAAKVIYESFMRENRAD